MSVSIPLLSHLLEDHNAVMAAETEVIRHNHVQVNILLRLSVTVHIVDNHNNKKKIIEL